MVRSVAVKMLIHFLDPRWALKLSYLVNLNGKLRYPQSETAENLVFRINFDHIFISAESRYIYEYIARTLSRAKVC